MSEKRARDLLLGAFENLGGKSGLRRLAELHSPVLNRLKLQDGFADRMLEFDGRKWQRQKGFGVGLLDPENLSEEAADSALRMAVKHAMLRFDVCFGEVPVGTVFKHQGEVPFLEWDCLKPVVHGGKAFYEFRVGWLGNAIDASTAEGPKETK